MDENTTIKIVREVYGKIAQGQVDCGCGSCSPNTTEFAKSIGYSEEELMLFPMRLTWLSVVAIQQL